MKVQRRIRTHTEPRRERGLPSLRPATPCPLLPAPYSLLPAPRSSLSVPVSLYIAQCLCIFLWLGGLAKDSSTAPAGRGEIESGRLSWALVLVHVFLGSGRGARQQDWFDSLRIQIRTRTERERNTPDPSVFPSRKMHMWCGPKYPEERHFQLAWV